MRLGGNQTGSIALVMVMILMTMGLLLLKALHIYQENARDEFFREKKYIEAFNLAESALAWGLQQSWRLSTYRGATWQCQSMPIQGGTSCIKHYKGGQFVLLGRGEYQGRYHVTVYRWVAAIPKSQKIRPRIKGWIDYCPVTQKGFC
ncbi:YgdB family protein [Providencia vermicola]|uniref:YgdB family protein n=3 Tax=Providencia TaxID=586 RepID=A0AAI9HYQ4_PROST|nr:MULTISPECIES: YgdB family protein [Providencia]ELR5043302.1 YgdB family protein [Providencia rettgeri]MTB40807.1 DUF2509 family protein [Providencia sp. wls1949]MTC07346.1 DUF2509 family protein [Providencia sp. wls1948]WBA58940.1 YgdB family protein [Providencia sp. 21OH12SH02B-Prov]ELR5034537.1 YgdB family protein [Providencia stuartii]